MRPYGLADRGNVGFVAKNGADDTSLTAGECSNEVSLRDRFDAPGIARDVALKIFCLLGYRDGDVWPTSPKAFGVYDLGF